MPKGMDLMTAYSWSQKDRSCGQAIGDNTHKELCQALRLTPSREDMRRAECGASRDRRRCPFEAALRSANAAKL
ncbi:hypothetical protein IG631_01885 [Alternaria alternata]|nr:hypothetical protein IG631_01885 [Alternaria alternata]